jgi:hypothetical protein
MIKICVLEKSWILVGELEKDGNYYYLRKGSFIRRWGTTKGLGEIAKDGPTKNTILDKVGAVKFHENQLIFTISCEEEKWKI